jgi:hypothetical protein
MADDSEQEAFAWLYRTIEKLAALNRISLTDLARLVASFRLYLRGGSPTLDDAFSLIRHQGQHRIADVIRRRQAFEIRDHHWRQAATTFDKTASEMVSLTRNYAATAWRVDCREACCPARYANRIEWHLWHAMKAWPAVVGVRQMQAILSARS